MFYIRLCGKINIQLLCICGDTSGYNFVEFIWWQILDNFVGPNNQKIPTPIFMTFILKNSSFWYPKKVNALFIYQEHIDHIQYFFLYDNLPV